MLAWLLLLEPFSTGGELMKRHGPHCMITGMSIVEKQGIVVHCQWKVAVILEKSV